MIIKIILIAIALGGFAYGFYSQTQARKYISKEKIAKLKDTSIIANGPMPPKAMGKLGTSRKRRLKPA